MDSTDAQEAWIAALQSALSFAGLESQRIDEPGEDGATMSVLAVEIPTNDAETTRPVTLAFLPAGQAVRQFRLLQAWMSLGPLAAEDVMTLPVANGQAIVGHGAIQATELHFRHVWPIPNATNLTPEMVEEWLSLFVFSADMVLDLLVAER